MSVASRMSTVRQWALCGALGGALLTGCSGARASRVETGDFLAIEDVTVIDGTGTPPKTHQTVHIRQGRLVWVGPASDAPAAAGARRLTLPGRVVTPGLVMVHEHLVYQGSPRQFSRVAPEYLRLYLAAGVTTIRTAGDVDTSDYAVADAIASGALVGPRLIPSAPIINGPGVPYFPATTDPAAAAAAVRAGLARGVRWFKIYANVSPVVAESVVVTAHRGGAKVMGHLCSLTFREAIALGVDDLQHGWTTVSDFTPGKAPSSCPDPRAMLLGLSELDIGAPEVRSLITAMVRSGVVLTSTLPVFEVQVPGRPPVPTTVLDYLAAEPRAIFDEYWQRVQRDTSAWPRRLFQRSLAFERAFFEAGGLLAAGTDPTGRGGVLAGFGAHRELELLVEAGLRPLEAIRVGTWHGARALGAEQEFGSIRVGLRADLVILRDDPSRDIRNLQSVELVIRDGRTYDPQVLRAGLAGQVAGPQAPRFP